MTKNAKGTLVNSMDSMPSTVHLNVKDLPAAKTWQPGEEYVLTLKVKQTGLHMHEGQGSAEFEVTSAKGKPADTGENEKSPEEVAAEKINNTNQKKRRGY